MDKPIPWNMCELGYTWNFNKRMKDHKAHTSSMAELYLVDAICQVEFKGKYKMWQKILFVCWAPYQAVLGEHLFSILTSSYIWFGGFNGTIGGGSNESAGRLDQWEYDYWAATLRMSDVRNRVNEEKARLMEIIKLKRRLKAAQDGIALVKEVRAQRWNVEKSSRKMALKQSQVEEELVNAVDTYAVLGMKTVNAVKHARATDEQLKLVMEKMEKFRLACEKVREVVEPLKQADEAEGSKKRDFDDISQ